MSKSIRAVLLDADGVIQSVPAHRQAVFDLASGDPKRTDEFLTEVFEEELPCLAGQGDFPSKVKELLGRWGSKITLAQCLGAWTAIDPDPDVLQLVAEVRSRGVPVGLASSQEAYRANYMSTTLDYKNVFDHEFYSCDLGYVKPDNAYFLSVVNQLGLEPRTILFLDDNRSIVDSALACGIIARPFDLKHQTADDMRKVFVEHGLV